MFSNSSADPQPLTLGKPHALSPPPGTASPAGDFTHKQMKV
jgi:hypothetical protein